VEFLPLKSGIFGKNTGIFRFWGVGSKKWDFWDYLNRCFLACSGVCLKFLFSLNYIKNPNNPNNPIIPIHPLFGIFRFGIF
jgi:hypothetical protein